MPGNRGWIVAALLSLALVAAHGDAAEAGGYSGRVEGNAAVCATHDVMRVAQGPEYRYQGNTYYFCYPGCLERFKGAPERFHLAKDTVSGELVEKARALLYAVDGKVHYFAEEEHRKAFSEDPDAYRTRLSQEGKSP